MRVIRATIGVESRGLSLTLGWIQISTYMILNTTGQSFYRLAAAAAAAAEEEEEEEESNFQSRTSIYQIRLGFKLAVDALVQH